MPIEHVGIQHAGKLFSGCYEACSVTCSWAVLVIIAIHRLLDFVHLMPIRCSYFRLFYPVSQYSRFGLFGETRFVQVLRSEICNIRRYN